MLYWISELTRTAVLKHNLSNAPAPPCAHVQHSELNSWSDVRETERWKLTNNSGLKLAKQQAERSSDWMNINPGCNNLLHFVSAHKILLMLLWYKTLPACAVLDKHTVYRPHTAQHYLFSWSGGSITNVHEKRTVAFFTSVILIGLHGC